MRTEIRFLILELVLILANLISFAPAGNNVAFADQDSTDLEQPIVVFVHSRECPICAKVRPIVDSLESTYGGKARFVRLDVTDDKSKQIAKQSAKELKIGSFFALYEDSFPCVGVFNSKRKCVKELFGENAKEKYEKAIDKAISS